MNPAARPLGQHFDDSWRDWETAELAPGDTPRGAVDPLHCIGSTLTESEVVAICRAHFATFQNLQVAAEYYGLTDGRLSQIQNGLHVGCPRILSSLGIKRARGGAYIRIDPVPYTPAEKPSAPEEPPEAPIEDPAAAVALEPCPCGRVPQGLEITHEAQSRWACVSGDCCASWGLLFKIGGLPDDSPECLEKAAETWNSAPRGSGIKSGRTGLEGAVTAFIRGLGATQTVAAAARRTAPEA